MKNLLLALALLLSFSAQASDLESTKAANLLEAVKANCEMPVRMANYTRFNFERFVAQVVFPDLKMLNTAFLNGFSALDSKNLDRGLCVVVFLGLPNDPTWEKNFDFYGRAQKAGKIPAQMFAGFDEGGKVLLQPTADQN